MFNFLIMYGKYHIYKNNGQTINRSLLLKLNLLNILISSHCYEFYKKIYTSIFSQATSDAFFSSIEVKAIDKK